MLAESRVIHFTENSTTGRINMYVVTFYSYKDGVGRTMALVNTAVELATNGRKVLIVDFDLEAPGISTYSPFTSLTMSPGIVEYVTEYVRTAQAPPAADYIQECKVNTSSIWVLPAGTRDVGYSTLLHSIDWNVLYTRFHGYELFEDLKQQWAQQGFDYVLIDSRTGYTDVGGICTRHLPDAVVLMFFPNDQNLAGLEGIAKEIRGEATSRCAQHCFTLSVLRMCRISMMKKIFLTER